MSPGELASLIGQSMQGNWILTVSDRAAKDVGTLRSWRLELTSIAIGDAPAVTERAAVRPRKSDRKAATPPTIAASPRA